MTSTIRSLARPIKKSAENWLPAARFMQPSWSQCGEDRILAYLLSGLVKDRPVEYVDIGANHPFRLNNTALFYKAGSTGVLVEPNYRLATVLKRKRPRDIVLQCGVGTGGASIADYYMFDSHTLNTFSHDEARRYIAMGQKQIGVEQVELRDVNELLDIPDHLDLLNLDVEGLDLAVLKSIDWRLHRPAAICVETITFEVDSEPLLLEGIFDLMHVQGYKQYASTYINTIFVDQQLWNSRFV